MKYLIIIGFFFCTATAMAQDFKTDITTAKTAYAAGKLEEAHFALLQAMQEMDLIIGKEILKILPAKMDTLQANLKDDNISSNAGFIGSTLHRSYGANSQADLTIIGNSPLVSTLNAFLNTPLMGTMSNGNNKIIKIQGYKGQLTKDDNGNGQTDYTVQVPLGNALVTFIAKNTTDTQITTWANTLPLQQIAKLVQ